MIPASISATAMQVATACMARYAAENIGRNRAAGNSAPANLGTACHAALEQYVQTAVMDGQGAPTLEYLLDLFKMHYIITFDVHEASGPLFDDGVEMLTRWHERQDFSGFTVYSVEVKSSFEVRALDSSGASVAVPFNYIWDRCDQLDETTYRIVDYKTWRAGVQPEDLRNKLQARCYALAAQIQFPHATKIWVQFDQLRYDSVGTVFTKEDNIATWRYLQKTLKMILDTAIEDAKETINPDCRWCIRKSSCNALARNASIGGLASMPTSEMIDRRATIAAQLDALTWAANELDAELLRIAQEEDLEQLSSESYTAYWTRSSRRAIDRTDALEKILGPQLWSRVGKTSVTMGNIDKLLKGKDLTDEQKAQVRSLIGTNYGEPTLKTKPTNKIDKVD